MATESRSKTPEMPLKARIIGAIGYGLIRVFGMTLRVNFIDHSEFSQNRKQKSIIWPIWHNGLFCFPLIARKFIPERQGACLASASKDGAIAADVVSRLGITPIRGSSSRRGGQAMVELRRWLANGYDIGLTPDGPKGPKYKLRPGLIKLAQASGAKIMPLRADYHNAWKLKTWDNFRIPKPFSRVDIHIGPFVQIDAEADDEEFEAVRRRVERIMKGNQLPEDNPSTDSDSCSIPNMRELEA